jgi:vesicular inhibitory amino acid transporter
VSPLLGKGASHPDEANYRYNNIRFRIEDRSITGTIRLQGEVSIDPRHQELWEPLLDEALLVEKQGGGSSVLGAMFNVVNLFMGVTLLSVVYAVAQGGILSFVSLLLAGFFMCLSGCFLGGCLGEIPAASAPSYADAAGLIWGPAGRVLAVTFCFMELFGNAAMNLIVMWYEIESLMKIALPDGLFGLDVHNLAVVCGSLGLLPLFLTGNLKTLSYLSLVGIVCTVIVTLAVLSLAVVDPKREVFPEGHKPGYELATPKVLLSAGIFCMALSQHSALPAVRNSLADPKKFNRCAGLHWVIAVSWSS